MRHMPLGVWTASAVTLLANSADTFVLFLVLWLAEPQGWTGTQTAMIVLALRLPVLASGWLVGRAVDRWGVRRTMLLDQAGRVVLLGLLLLSAGGNRLPLPAVLVLGGLAGALSPATYAGIRTLVPRLVPHQQLVQANAVVAVGDQMPLLLGTALLGPALVLLGPSRSLLVPIGLLLAALVLTWRSLPADPRPARSPSTAGSRFPSSSSFAAVGEAGGSAWSSRVVAVVALSTAYYFVYGPFETASPSYIRNQLGGAEGAYSVLWALFGVGALVSLRLAPRLARWRPGVVNATGAVAWGLTMLPLALLDSVPIAALVFLLGGLVWGPYTTIETTALQRWTHPSRHGAVFGLQRSLLTTATPLGAAVGAIALGALTPGAVLALSAGGCVLAGLAALASRDLRSAR